jgi:hypothetical protein
MEAKNLKMLIICAGILVASYIVRNLVTEGIRMAYRPVARTALRQAKAKAIPPPNGSPQSQAAPLSAAVAAPPSPLANLSGVWYGREAVIGKGLCQLNFELREKKEEPGSFSGFSRLICGNFGNLVDSKTAASPSQAVNGMNPEAVIFSGGIEKGSIQLHADKVIGTDTNCCAPTSLNFTPFGNGLLAAQWQEGSCTGGHMIMHRLHR